MRARLDGMGDLPVGGAVVTPGGDTLNPFIIHAVLESPEESMSVMGNPPRPHERPPPRP